MADGERTAPLVWYAAYGSNLSYARFTTYLAGGTPEGRTRPQAGASDPTPPAADRPYLLRRPLVFARDAPSWGGGGVAFVGADEDPDALTYARIYLITAGQLREVHAQENDLPPTRGAGLVSEARLTTAEAGARIDTGAGEYGLLLCVGREPIDLPEPTGPGGPAQPGASGGPIGADAPVWTFTSPRPVDDDLRAPSDAYLSTICRGLLETFWVLPPGETDEEEAVGRISLRGLESYLTRCQPGGPHPHPDARVRKLLRTRRQELVELHLRDGAERPDDGSVR